MSTYNKLRGFSLVELMVSIVVLAIMASIAIPSFQSWLRNTQIRNAAESVTNGLQLARAEAVARNTNVRFQLTSNLSATCALSSTSTNWVISQDSAVNSCNSTASNIVTPRIIQVRAASEDSNNVTASSLAADLATAATTITFNNFGLVTTNADGSPSLNQINFTATGGSQTLRVAIGTGGNARMCDPNKTPGSSPAAC